MVSKQELNKRRVSANRVAQQREQVVARRDRRKQLIAGAIVSFLALALIAPLTAGLLLTGSSDDSQDNQPADTLPISTIPPSLVDPAFAGAGLTGPTPCPATDGSQQRTTQFATAPPTCINDAATYEVVLTAGTGIGDITISIDPTIAPEAANLFVTFANYGVYDSALVTPIGPGLTILGGDGDTGFTIAATEAPDDGLYPVGSIVMFTRLDGSLQGQLALVTSEEAGNLLAEIPVHPIIGEITSGLDAAIALHEASINDLSAGLRVTRLIVSESAPTG